MTLRYKIPTIRHRSLILEELEERIVLDASVDASQQENNDAEQSGIQQDTGMKQTSSEGGSVKPESKSDKAPDPLGEIFNKDLSVVLISNALNQLEALENASVDEAEIIIYDGKRDGLASINDEIGKLVSSRGQEISHLALLSHGTPAVLQVSEIESFDFFTVKSNPDQWSALGSMLAADAIVDLYGCDIGKGDSGKALVDQIALLTQATVRASDDLTGTGGDWDLEIVSSNADANSASENGLVDRAQLASLDIQLTFTDYEFSITRFDAALGDLRPSGLLFDTATSSESSNALFPVGDGGVNGPVTNPVDGDTHDYTVYSVTITGGDELTDVVNPDSNPPRTDKTGTAAPDNLTADAPGSNIYGLGGNDTLTGGVGDDVIDGGDGSDTVSGIAGSNVLWGGFGSDTIIAGIGDDILVAHDVNNSFDTTAGGTNQLWAYGSGNGFSLGGTDTLFAIGDQSSVSAGGSELTAYVDGSIDSFEINSGTSRLHATGSVDIGAIDPAAGIEWYIGGDLTGDAGSVITLDGGEILYVDGDLSVDLEISGDNNLVYVGGEFSGNYTVTGGTDNIIYIMGDATDDFSISNSSDALVYVGGNLTGPYDTSNLTSSHTLFVGGDADDIDALDLLGDLDVYVGGHLAGLDEVSVLEGDVAFQIGTGATSIGTVSYSTSSNDEFVLNIDGGLGSLTSLSVAGASQSNVTVVGDVGSIGSYTVESTKANLTVTGDITSIGAADISGDWDGLSFIGATGSLGSLGSLDVTGGSGDESFSLIVQGDADTVGPLSFLDIDGGASLTIQGNLGALQEMTSTNGSLTFGVGGTVTSIGPFTYTGNANTSLIFITQGEVGSIGPLSVSTAKSASFAIEEYVGSIQSLSISDVTNEVFIPLGGGLGTIGSYTVENTQANFTVTGDVTSIGAADISGDWDGLSFIGATGSLGSLGSLDVTGGSGDESFSLIVQGDADTVGPLSFLDIDGGASLTIQGNLGALQEMTSTNGSLTFGVGGTVTSIGPFTYTGNANTSLIFITQGEVGSIGPLSVSTAKSASFAIEEYVGSIQSLSISDVTNEVFIPLGGGLGTIGSYTVENTQANFTVTGDVTSIGAADISGDWDGLSFIGATGSLGSLGSLDVTGGSGDESFSLIVQGDADTVGPLSFLDLDGGASLTIQGNLGALQEMTSTNGSLTFGVGGTVTSIGPFTYTGNANTSLIFITQGEVGSIGPLSVSTAKSASFAIEEYVGSIQSLSISDVTNEVFIPLGGGLGTIGSYTVENTQANFTVTGDVTSIGAADISGDWDGLSFIGATGSLGSLGSLDVTGGSGDESFSLIVQGDADTVGPLSFLDLDGGASLTIQGNLGALQEMTSTNGFLSLAVGGNAASIGDIHFDGNSLAAFRFIVSGSLMSVDSINLTGGTAATVFVGGDLISSVALDLDDTELDVFLGGAWDDLNELSIGTGGLSIHKDEDFGTFLFEAGAYFFNAAGPLTHEFGTITYYDGLQFEELSIDPDTGEITFRSAQDSNGWVEIEVKASDGLLFSDSYSFIFIVTPGPELDLDTSEPGTGYATTFSEDSGSISIAGNVTITEAANNTLVSAVITLINNPDGSDEFIVVGGLPGGLTAEGSGTTSVTLTGTASPSDYEAAIASITYRNKSDYPDTSDRTITVVINDGQAISETAIASITYRNTSDYLDTSDRTSTVVINDSQADSETAISTIEVIGLPEFDEFGKSYNDPPRLTIGSGAGLGPLSTVGSMPEIGNLFGMQSNGRLFPESFTSGQESDGEREPKLYNGLFSENQEVRDQAWNSLIAFASGYKVVGAEEWLGLVDFLAKLRDWEFGKTLDEILLVFNAGEIQLLEWFNSLMSPEDDVIGNQQGTALEIEEHVQQSSSIKSVVFDLAEMRVADLFSHDLSNHAKLGACDTNAEPDHPDCRVFDLRGLSLVDAHVG
jgi:hypothetical protein